MARRPRRRKGARDAAVDLFAHVCEVMGLFPKEGNEALAELVGRMKVGRLSGAAVKQGRRAGSSRNGQGS
jgi:hypothetical protein